jgi:uncharacterized protein YjiS (DUF1127 family)
MDTTMRAPASVLPLTPGFRLQLIVEGLHGWLKRLAQARRHRRQAAALASCDGRTLADIGISRADLRDAFSEPFWQDPTVLLRERALERRWSRSLAREEAFQRLRTDRPARHSV